MLSTHINSLCTGYDLFPLIHTLPYTSIAVIVLHSSIVLVSTIYITIIFFTQFIPDSTHNNLQHEQSPLPSLFLYKNLNQTCCRVKPYQQKPSMPLNTRFLMFLFFQYYLHHVSTLFSECTKSLQLFVYTLPSIHLPKMTCRSIGTYRL